MQEKLLPLTSDYVFKRIFGQEENKQGLKDFLESILDEEMRVSPSNCRTTSTICSRTLGPAIAPSLVMWPMRMTGIPLSLARRSRAAAHSRTCVTEEAAESIFSE